MRKLIDFIRSVYVVVLFVVLEVTAVVKYAHSTDYTRARLLANTMQVVGGMHGIVSDVRHYFHLKEENRQLLEYVAVLQQRLSEYEILEHDLRNSQAQVKLDTLLIEAENMHYRTAYAAVVSNSINKPDNYLVINRGMEDEVCEEMAVVSPSGSIVGYVVSCSEHYSVVMPVLNTSFHTSGTLVGSDQYGKIYWDGLDPEVVILDELPKYADPQPGQEVITPSITTIFPKGILVGRVIDAELNPMGTFYRVRVALATRMSALHDVLLIYNQDQDEIRALTQPPTQP